MRIERLNTLTIFKSGQLEKYHQLGYNLIGCGASRGGTSALGILMSFFGLDIGATTHPTTHEDLDFVKVITSRKHDEFPSLIAEKTARNPNWAVKLPHAMQYMEVFDKHCERAVFFIVIRNPLSVAHSLIKHDQNYSADLESYIKGIEHSWKFYSKLESLQKLNSPFILCEYEKIIAQPENFVRDFLAAVGKTASQTDIETATKLITGSGYRAVNADLPQNPEGALS